MDISNQLKTIGLNQSEITVYLFLLQNGESSPPIVSRETKIARTNCYNILNELVSKNLVEELYTGSKKIYRASEPASIVKYVERKKHAVELVLPQLREIAFGNKHIPKFRYYAGLSGVQNVLLQSLLTNDIYAFGFIESLKKNHPLILEWYIKEAGSRGVNLKNTDQQLGDSINGHVAYSPILITNNTIYFLSLDTNPWGVTIENKKIADSLKIVFNLINQKLL